MNIYLAKFYTGPYEGPMSETLAEPRNFPGHLLRVDFFGLDAVQANDIVATIPHNELED